MFNTNFNKQKNSTEGVNETAVDLFATMTAIMMLLTTVFISTMTEKAGIKSKDSSNIKERYYLIDFGNKDLNEEKVAIEAFKKKTNETVIQIGNHIPSLWKSLAKSHVYNIPINETVQNISYSKFNKFIEKINKKIMDNKSSLPSLSWNLADKYKHFYTDFNPVSLKIYDFKVNKGSRQYQKETFQELQPAFVLEMVNYDNLSKWNTPFVWVCNKNTFICKQVSEDIKDVSLSHCKSSNIHNVLKEWINANQKKIALYKKADYVVTYMLALAENYHAHFACGNSRIMLTPEQLKYINLNFLSLIKKYKIILKDSEQNINGLSFLQLNSNNTKWQASKGNECLNIVEGKLSFSKCTNKKVYNHAR